MALNIQQYNLKTDMEQLYEMRMNRQDNEPVLTTNDIKLVTVGLRMMKVTLSVLLQKKEMQLKYILLYLFQIRAFQEEKVAKDAEIIALKEKLMNLKRKIKISKIGY